MIRRRTLNSLLFLLAAVLVGTVLVLSSVSYYLSIDYPAYITEDEVNRVLNNSQPALPERIPRIIHQTWKSETLPPRWAKISKECRDMMPDYEYKLWTDASAREFIAEHYSWYLDAYDNYKYPIQRADAIRYFVLHYYGGIYIDLDIGCLRPLDPLLVHPVILPKTIPVGVSNDLMFAEKGHPFMAQTIHSIMSFDYDWVLNYPTVMFSTGPMFLSAVYGAYTSALNHPTDVVRILPKSLYGKNAKPDEAPHSFFSHYYGSSWHADDAAFIGFLGTWGKGLMWIGLLVLVGGLIRLAFAPRRKTRLARIGGYEVMMPRWTKRNNRWYLDLGWFALPASGITTTPPSPISLPSESVSDADEEDVQLLPLYDSRSASPAPSDFSIATDGTATPSGSTGGSVLDCMRRARNQILSSVFNTETAEPPSTPSRSRRRRLRSRGVLFFFPAFLTPDAADAVPAMPFSPHARSSSYSRIHAVPLPSSQYPPEKQQYAAELERAGLLCIDDDDSRQDGAGCSSFDGSSSGAC
ncbi:nucleotide-diphospho-sugar transferase [Trametes polyzona]|nr:nucleotide-diphospho-sugar transferase [Trametes polyzona]